MRVRIARFKRVLLGLLVLALAVLVGPAVGSAGPPPAQPPTQPRADWGEPAERSGARRRQVGVRVEPMVLHFTPETEEVAIALVNDGILPLDIVKVRFEGQDWEAFAVRERTSPNEQKPEQVRRDQQTVLQVRVNAQALATRDERGQPAGYRSGEAQLVFETQRGIGRVPIRFRDPSAVERIVIPALVKILALVMLFIMPLASLLTWLERKQSAMMQDRLGPNMANIPVFGAKIRLWGLLHIAADGLKMLFKEDFVPRQAHRALYTLAPLMAFVPALVVFAIVPFGDAVCYHHVLDVVSQADVNQCADGRAGSRLQIATIDVGLLFYFAIASLATYGTTLAGWSSFNKWSILGGLRASAQMISYEVAIGLTIVGALLVYGTLEPHTLVHAQLDSHWGILLQFPAFILFFTAAMAETKRAPFDLPEGESEIIGYFVEYSGMRFGLFFLGEFIEIVFAAALIATIFFGGWALPFGMLEAGGFSSPIAAQVFFIGGGIVLCAAGIGAVRAGPHARTFGSLLVLVGLAHFGGAAYSMATGWGTELPHVAVVAIGLVTWGIKVAALCWVQLLIRWTLPRFRYDQLMALGWKGLLPLSLANIALTAIIVYLMLGGNPVP